MTKTLTDHERKVLLDAQATCYRLCDKYGVHIAHEVASRITTLLDVVDRQPHEQIQESEVPW